MARKISVKKSAQDFRKEVSAILEFCEITQGTLSETGTSL